MLDYKKYLTNPIRSDRKPLYEMLPLKHPLRVLIDPSDICNFRCEFCFQSKRDFKGTKMTRETFDKVVEQLREFEEPINVIHMYGLGEPLINEQLPYFVERVKEEKVAKEVAITSNGSLLTEDLSQSLINAGLDRLSISLNGLKNDDFKKNAGVYVDFEKIYTNIKYFYRIRKKCHLHIKINGEEFSEEQKGKFVELFKNYADSINIDHIVNVWPGMEVVEASTNRMYDYDLAGLKNKGELPGVCPLMFYELFVHADGTVSPCAVDYEFRSQNLGNVYGSTLKQIWESDQLAEIRVQQLQGTHNSYHVCNGCQYVDCAATVNITPYRYDLLSKYQNT